MPLANRQSRRPTIDIWPGFVDALAQLLMVIIFILLIFTAGQFYLSEALSGRDQALKQLQQQVSQLADLLALERQAKEDLRLGAVRVEAQLKSAEAERDALTTRVAELAAKADEATKRADAATGQLQAATTAVGADKDKIELQLRQIESLQRDIEALKAVRKDLEAKVSGLAAAQQQSREEAGALRDRAKQLEAKLASEQEKTLLAQKQIDERDLRLQQAGEALAAEKKISADALARVTQLSEQIAALRDQLARIAAALDLANAKVKQQQGQIVELGKRLNMALVSKVEELNRYRSEFFGRLREILGDRAGIRIVGDRFVFQSEVLFAQGSADLDDGAKARLQPVFGALKEIAAKIPSDIHWLLQVEGHTDRRPIDTPQFPSNWELSAARAISVVRYAMAQGIPPDHVAAAGFADAQPIDAGDNAEAYRRNRRIELKLTQQEK